MTGVQTCALPICSETSEPEKLPHGRKLEVRVRSPWSSSRDLLRGNGTREVRATGSLKTPRPKDGRGDGAVALSRRSPRPPALRATVSARLQSLGEQPLRTPLIPCTHRAHSRSSTARRTRRARTAAQQRLQPPALVPFRPSSSPVQKLNFSVSVRTGPSQKPNTLQIHHNPHSSPVASTLVPQPGRLGFESRPRQSLPFPILFPH